MSEYQTTINKEVSLQGVGLHTGQKTTLTFKPAPPDKGVVFIRKNLPNHPQIPAIAKHAFRMGRSTSLEKDGIKVSTAEHILAAIAGAEIDNLLVELDNQEVPVVDGSAKPFLATLEKAGRVTQNKKREFFTLSSPLMVASNDSYLIILPAETERITYTLQFPHPLVGEQAFSLLLNQDNFQKNIAPARTFGFLEEIKKLQKKGLLKGGSLDTAVVIGPKKILNKELRFPNEFVRHKILDIVGDLILSGKMLKKAHIIGVRSGHSLNIQMAKKIAGLSSKNREQNQQEGEEERDRALGIEEIKKILPHRYPFLFVDKILYLGEKRVVGLKNVTGHEYFFQGHFPEFPIMPAVIILEAMAQVAGVLLLSKTKNKGKLAYFAGIDNARFRKPVVPGDQLIMEVEITRLRTNTGKGHAIATVGEKRVAEADCIFSLVERQ